MTAVALPGPTLHFLGRPIILDFGPGIPNARSVEACVDGLAARLEAAHAGEDALIEAISLRVAGYGCTARLVARTPEAIEIAVERQ